MLNPTHLGLDTHKDTIAVAVLCADQAEADRCTIPNTPEAIRKFVATLGGPSQLLALQRVRPDRLRHLPNSSRPRRALRRQSPSPDCWPCGSAGEDRSAGCAKPRATPSRWGAHCDSHPEPSGRGAARLHPATALRMALDDHAGAGNYELVEGEGSFYAPKIDFLISDAIGREWQTGTLQLDLQLPARFGCKYRAADGIEVTPALTPKSPSSGTES